MEFTYERVTKLTGMDEGNRQEFSIVSIWFTDLFVLRIPIILSNYHTYSKLDTKCYTKLDTDLFWFKYILTELHYNLIVFYLH